ncbi:MAG: DNA topoisomerase I [Candidatus Micrarchaeia archaeon]
MKLIIAEKPKVAQKIADALSDSSVQRKKGKGQSYYFEFEKNGENIAVAPAVGHLYSLEESKKSNTYPVFDIEWRPAYEISKDSDYTKGYVQTIEMLAKDADEIIIACDYDVEGSLIGYNAMRYAGHRDVGTRMKFSSLTKEDLVNAYTERGDLDLANALAGESRHILDWYYGINLSRALMSAVRSTGKFQVMSIGRVQGPALKLLAEKEKSIKAFIPTPYWELTCEIDKIRFKHEKQKFTDQNEAKTTFELSKNPPQKITEITKKPFIQKPNPPFDLTSLQVEAYKQFKFPPQQTQAIAQTLYENSMISYPRTSSQKLPAKLGLDKIILILSKQAAYAPLCQKLIHKKLFTPFEGKKEDPAHPAIHPTGQHAAVGAREQKVYDLIVKRFLSCFAPDATRESQKVVALCGTQNYTTNGARTIENGWFEFYAPYLKLEEVTLPAWTLGQAVNATDFKMEEKMTQPPKRFTPASIISELEDRNLGTKATRATIIETLFKRGYLTGTKSIEVSSFGLSVANVMDKYAPEIMDEELTREIEKEMEAIQEDPIHAKNVVENGKKILTKTLEKYKPHEKDVGKELTGGLADARAEASQLGPCPTCKTGTLRKILSRNKKWFAGCSGYPNCTQTYPLPQMGLIESTGKACEHDGSPIIKVIRKGKRPFEMCVAVGCPSKASWGAYKKPLQAAKPESAATKSATATTAKSAPTATASLATTSKSASNTATNSTTTSKSKSGAVAKTPSAKKPRKTSSKKKVE